jgi:hypothetical protein
MSEIALNVFVNVLNRVVHFPKVGRTGRLFDASAAVGKTMSAR